MRLPLLRVRLGLYLVRKYGLSRIRASLRYHAHGQTRSFGLRRDLLQPFDPPTARVDVRLRPAGDTDLRTLLVPAPDEDRLSAEENARRYRFRMIAAGLPGCHVAVTADGEPCYMQWLLTSRSDSRVRWALGPLFPPLDDDCVLLEGAYTPANMRGLRIMPAAMAALAELGRERGARWALTFIDEQNEASIKGARRAGFEPYVLRVERWRSFRRTVSFEPLPTAINR